jgi:lipoprotein signal peptidase
MAKEKTEMRRLTPIALFVIVAAALVIEQVRVWLGRFPACSERDYWHHVFASNTPTAFSFWTSSAGVTIAISGLTIGASLFVIRSQRYASTDRRWAYAALGIILGFWIGAAGGPMC